MLRLHAQGGDDMAPAMQAVGGETVGEDSGAEGLEIGWRLWLKRGVHERGEVGEGAWGKTLVAGRSGDGRLKRAAVSRDERLPSCQALPLFRLRRKKLATAVDVADKSPPLQFLQHGLYLSVSVESLIHQRVG